MLLLCRRLEFAQAVVEVDVEVLLPFLRRLEFVGQHFDLAAQFGDVLTDQFELVGEFDLLPLGGFHALETRSGFALEGVDAGTCFLVVEHAGMGRGECACGQQNGEGGSSEVHFGDRSGETGIIGRDQK